MQKDFNDFLKTLDQDELTKMTDNVNSRNMEVHFSLTPEGINDLMTKSASANLLLTLQVLQKYHDWLQSGQ